MLNQKTSRWLGSLVLLMLMLRVGYKYYRSQQRPEYEARLTALKARVQTLTDSIEANQDTRRAQGRTGVVADSAIIAADTTTRQTNP